MKKSGSSTIQHFFSTNRRALRGLGIDYPAVALSRNNHHNIAHELSGSHKFNPAHGTLADLVSYRKRVHQDTMFLSAEAFESLSENSIATLKQALARTQDNEKIHIVMMVRDIVDLMPSSYAQKIKYGIHVHDFDVFFKRRMKEARIDYHETASKWADVFGWSNLKVRALDPKYLLNGNIIDETLVLLGADLRGNRISQMDRAGVRNIRPGWRVLECVRALFSGNHGLPDNHSLADAVEQNAGDLTLGRLAITAGDQLGWNLDKGYYLTHAQAKKCLGIYQAAIDRLNERLPERLPSPQSLFDRGFVEREELPSIELIPRSESLAFYDLTAELWRQHVQSNA